MREMRTSPRVPVSLTVHYKDGDELRSSFVESISGGGVFIRTRQPLAIGTPLIMEIQLEDGQADPIRIQGKVVWGRLIGREDGMGVQFTEPVPERIRKLLTTWDA